MRWNKPSYTERQKKWEDDLRAAREQYEKQKEALKEWHPMFAWRPKSTKDGTCRMWLERILCRLHHNENNGRDEWEYRPITILEKDLGTTGG